MWQIVALVALPLVLGQDGPTATLEDGMGVLLGKEKWTVGNLGVEPRRYYSFRNIPYAHMVSEENRYKQPTPWTDGLGTEANPYDATKTGPTCFQGSTSEEDFNTLINKNVEDMLFDIIDGVISSILDAPFPTQTVVDYLIELLEGLLGLEGIADMTVGELFEELLDVSLSVSEECLHLSVSTPLDPTNDDLGADLPVMFWVHGGGFTSGTGEAGNDLARLGEVDEDLIVVAINYRVGPLGFTCLPTDEAAGNMGMLDMVQALKWVQTHIHKFGGDPNRVTIFGESAGSASIGHLVLSPLTDGLFAQGIGQSGSALSPWAFDEEPEYSARLVASYAGCEQEDVDELVTCLRALPPEEINQAFNDYEKDERLEARLGFAGSIPCAQTHGADKFYSADDGDNPEDLLIAGEYSDLPIFFGANTHEGSYVYGVLYNDYVLPNDLENDPEFLEYEMIEVMLRAVDIDQGYALRDLIEDYYFKPNQMGSLEAMTPGILDMLSTFFLKASSYAMVEYNADRAKSYWYSVEHISEKKSFFNVFFIASRPKYVEESGVCHGDELMYLFDARLPLVLCHLEPMIVSLMNQMVECDLDVPCISDSSNVFMTEYADCLTGELNDVEQVWSDRIVRAWTNFAIHGDPTFTTDGDLPDLPAWSRSEPAYLAFRDDAASVQYNYPDTYNRVMLEATACEGDGCSTTTASTGENGNGSGGGGGGGGGAADLAATFSLAILMAAATIGRHLA